MRSGRIDLFLAANASMKKGLILLGCLCSFGLMQAQDHTAAPVNALVAQANDPMQLNESEHDFSKIPQGKPVFTYFIVRNTGSVPLKIDNVQASCGCTTPEWNKEPIPPGGTDRIKVGYNAASDGYFEKFITVQYNGNATKQIKIKGEVWKAPAGSAPANPSIQFLKQQIQ